jgi:hypothetical protein
LQSKAYTGQIFEEIIDKNAQKDIKRNSLVEKSRLGIEKRNICQRAETEQHYEENMKTHLHILRKKARKPPQNIT